MNPTLAPLTHTITREDLEEEFFDIKARLLEAGFFLTLPIKAALCPKTGDITYSQEVP